MASQAGLNGFMGWIWLWAIVWRPVV